MNKQKVLIFTVFVGLLGGGFFLWKNLKTTTSKKELKGSNEVLWRGAKKLRELWLTGVEEKISLKDCPESFPLDLDKEDIKGKYPSSFLQCNPQFLRCVYKEGIVNLNIKGKKESLQVHFSPKGVDLPYKMFSRAYENKSSLPPYSLYIHLTHQSKSFTFLLEENCHEVALPQRVYAVGAQRKSNEFYWDNFSRHIYIDRYLVTNRDIFEWFQQTGQKDKLKKIDKANLSSASSSLTIEERKEFCAYKGKRVLTSNILDAASFFPSSLEEQTYRRIFRGPLLWRYGFKGSFIEKYREEKIGVEKKNCRFIFSQECEELDKTVSQFRGSASSWMGAYQLLGGPLEYVHNHLYPRRNIMPSSSYYSWKAKGHEIGKRSFWDGEGLLIRNFNWGLESPPLNYSEFKVGFRCMKEKNEKDNF
jgi:hypothetical protein